MKLFFIQSSQELSFLVKIEITKHQFDKNLDHLFWKGDQRCSHSFPENV
jgi:hypothetical protein